MRNKSKKNYSPSKRIKRRSNFVRLLKIIFFVVGYHVVISPQNHCFLTHAELIKEQLFTFKNNKDEEHFCEVA